MASEGAWTCWYWPKHLSDPSTPDVPVPYWIRWNDLAGLMGMARMLAENGRNAWVTVFAPDNEADVLFRWEEGDGPADPLEDAETNEALARLGSADMRGTPLTLTLAEVHELAAYLDAQEREAGRYRKALEAIFTSRSRGRR